LGKRKMHNKCIIYNSKAAINYFFPYIYFGSILSLLYIQNIKIYLSIENHKKILFA